MTEYTITRPDAAADTEALQNALNMLKGSAFWDSPAAKGLLDLRCAIEEQLPKPAGPQEFGSIVRAGLDGLSDRVLWQRGPKHWMSENGGFVAKFDWLDNPEVLRVGVGEPVKDNGHYAVTPKDLRVGDLIRIRDHGQWRVISLNTEPGTIGLSADAYNQGAEDFAAKVRRELSAQAAQVITGPEKRCYSDALAAVAALLGEG